MDQPRRPDRPPPVTASSYESVVDRAVRQAQERGDLDGLPGAGRPIPGAGAPHDEGAWVRGLVEREGLSADVLLPASIRLRKELDALPEVLGALTTEGQVRAVAADLDARVVAWIRTPAGPPVRARRVDVEAEVARWRAARRPPPPGAPDPGPDRAPAGRRRWWRPRG